MRNVIIGTDWWTDCDDAAAMRIACRAMKDGKINILGIGVNACMEYSAPSVEAFITAEEVDVPIGIDITATDFYGTPVYQKGLYERLENKKTNSDYPDAADLYIQLLKKTEDKVEIVEIGFEQVLAEVVKREPELFNSKVSHVWIMAGKWDENPGKEHNFSVTKRAAKGASEFISNCKVPITFLGWEVGATVIVGSKLKKGDILKSVFDDHGSHDGRSAWDPMLMLLAVNGDTDGSLSGYDTIKGNAKVDSITGENWFTEDENGIHSYVVKNKPDEWYRDIIDEYIKSEI